MKNNPIVFYDGSCSLCSREISFYKGLEGSNCINWNDVSRHADKNVTPNLTKNEALSVFHIQTSDGSIKSGGEAFSHLWLLLPRFYYLGRLFQIKPFSWILNFSYNIFLKLRPFLRTR